MTDRALMWALRAAVAAPFLVALIALATQHWVPVLDLAMTELRVRDVFTSNTPLIGLPGRIGTFPDQGSHPGPLSFYLLWPTYRLFGSTAYALLVSTAVVNVGAAWVALWAAGRRGGRRLLVGVAAVVVVVIAWLGASVLTQPWNPYLPLVSFVVVLLCAWGVLDGDHLMLVPLVAFSTLCSQTHVPYLALCVVLCAVAFGVVGWRAWQGRSLEPVVRRSVLLAVGVGAVLWLPVFVDEFRRTPGNITMLREHFLSPPEQPVGLVTGVKTVLAHFDIVHLGVTLVSRGGYQLDTLGDLQGGSWQVGALVVVAWMVAAASSVRLTDRRIMRLHAVVGVSAVVAVVSTGRIFGKVWYYLTLWSWSIALLAVAATLWTAVVAWEARRARPLPIAACGGALMAMSLLLFGIDAVRVDPPEERLSRVLEALVEPTADALDEGLGAADGKGGKYAVVWDDAYFFGSQGFGLLNELERRGYAVFGSETYRVALTPSRVTNTSDVTAEVVLATGIRVDDWRAREGVEEVAFFEPRSPDEMLEFERLRAEAIEALLANDLPDVAEMVDTNLFSASVDPRLPPGVEPLLARMLILGQQTAVFIAPPGAL